MNHLTRIDPFDDLFRGFFVRPVELGNNPAQPPAIKPENNPSNGGIDGPLSVVIESPAENVVVNQSPIEISGQADPETVLTINDVIVLIGPDRRFSGGAHSGSRRLHYPSGRIF